MNVSHSCGSKPFYCHVVWWRPKSKRLVLNLKIRVRIQRFFCKNVCKEWKIAEIEYIHFAKMKYCHCLIHFKLFYLGMETAQKLQPDAIRSSCRSNHQRIRVRQEGSNPTYSTELRSISNNVLFDVSVVVDQPSHGRIGRGRSWRQHSPICKVRNSEVIAPRLP